MVAQNCSKVELPAETNTAAKGIRTIKLRYNSVYPRANSKPGSMLCFFNEYDKAITFSLFSRDLTGARKPWTGEAEFIFRPLFFHLIDLVENASISKMGLLSLLPTPENLINGKQTRLWKLAGIFLRHRF